MDLNILGKDYLTIDEAAHYSCVSVSQFREHAKDNGLLPIKWMGKVVYRKSDIQRAIELKWRQSQSGMGSTSSTGGMRPVATARG